MTTILQDLQSYFQANWVGEIQMGDQQFKAGPNEFIRLDIQPLMTANIGYAKQTKEIHGLLVTSFARNQIQASMLMDTVTAFVQAMDIPSGDYLSMEPKSQLAIVGQSDTHGGYAIKFLYNFEVLGC